MQSTYSKPTDLFLASIPRDPERPHYPDTYLDYALRRDRQVRRRPSGFRPPCEAVRYLRLRHLIASIRRSNLTRLQTAVFTARLRGESWREIGASHGHTHQAAHRIFKQAAAKVRKAWIESPFVD